MKIHNLNFPRIQEEVYKFLWKIILFKIKRKPQIQTIPFGYRQVLELEKLTLGALRKAVVEGDVVNGTLMAGQIAGLVNKQESCAEIISDIMSQAKTLLNR